MEKSQEELLLKVEAMIVLHWARSAFSKVHMVPDKELLILAV